VLAKLNCPWLLSSLYENHLARQFRIARIVAVNSDESDSEGIALYQNSYSRKLKLAAIEWATSTYKKEKKDGDPDRRITRYAAAKRLGITITMLRTWI
jgi:hypothetical protein